MKKKILLEIIAANREQLTQNSKVALDNLYLLHKEHGDQKDEACIMSLALNDSIASMVFDADYDRAITNSRRILDRFPASNQQYFVTRHQALIGRCLTLSGKYEPGKDILLHALETGENVLEGSDETTCLCADILHDLAMNNTLSGGNPKKTILYLGKALTLLSDTTFETRKGICLMGLGNVKYGEDKTRAALRYYLKASKVFESQYNPINLASVYNNIGLCYTSSGQTEHAEKYLTRALEVRLRIGNTDHIANSYFNLSQLHDLRKDTDKTYDNLLACRDYSRDSANKKLYLDALLWLESISLSRNDMATAMVFREERQKANL